MKSNNFNMQFNVDLGKYWEQILSHYEQLVEKPKKNGLFYLSFDVKKENKNQFSITLNCVNH